MEQTKRNAHKEDGVLAFHAYQSFLPGEVTAETAHQIGLELAHQMWGDDFEVLVCTHTDKKHFCVPIVPTHIFTRIQGKRYLSTRLTSLQTLLISPRAILLFLSLTT